MESGNKKQQNDLPPNPLDHSTFLSYIFFTWLIPTFTVGAKRELAVEDLYQPLDAHRSRQLGDRLCNAWNVEVRKSQKTGKPASLLRAFLKVFGWEIFALGIILLVLELVVRLSQPIFLAGLIQYYSKDNGDITEAYLYAAGVILCSVVNITIVHPYMLSQMHVGMKMRIAACSMIYRKTLCLTRNALGDTTAGQVVNLLSNDVARLEMSVLFVHYLWVGPVQVIVVTAIMYLQIGVSAIFGMLFLLAFVPFQIFLGKMNSKLRLKTALRTDERVRLMNEIIQGIQVINGRKGVVIPIPVIKMYAWEKPFAGLVEMARRKEIRVIRYVSYIRGILLSFIMFTTRVSVFLSLVGYALLGNVISAEKAFMVTAYYNLLRVSMTVFFPQGIGQFAETLVSISRIQRFITYDELPRYNESMSTQTTSTDIIKESIAETNISHLSAPGVSVENVCAKWNPVLSEYTLNNVNLKVQPGTLVAIIGPVGAGKSSLLQAILGELAIESGSVDINGVVSYASQEPWLFSASVRQNILFGQEMDRYRYEKVIKRCALERDLELFPSRDKTIVGERGASLSGGQKARINLARAVYREASVYLLDDPLSAVDSHVGRHLFDQCIRSHLKEKTVILITHQLQYLQNVDQIIAMSHGKVVAVGTYDELSASGLDFVNLLSAAEKEDEGGEGLHRRSSSKSIQRRTSTSSSFSSMNHIDDVPDVVQSEENREEGIIGWAVYKKYFQASGGLVKFIFLAFMFVLSQALASSGDYFVTYWVNSQANVTNLEDDFNVTDEVMIRNLRDVQRVVTRDLEKFWHWIVEVWSAFVEDDNFDVYVFTIITVLTVVITLIRSFVFFNSCMRASKKLHNVMFEGITHATMHFFHTNPTGRVLNRFSKDMGQVDEILPSIMIDVIQIFLSLAGIIVVVAIVNPMFLLPTLIIGVIFYYLRCFYLKTSTVVKRMEATSRSPIYSHLAASLNGLSTIRAFKAEQILMNEFDKHQDMHSSAYYMFISASRAFGFWLDIFCVIYIAIVTLSFFIVDDNGGNVGLAITQALGMTGMVQWGMRQSAELENTMTSVERLVEYETIDPEPALESSPDKKPPPTWPEAGEIIFDKLSLRYFPDPDSEYVLNELEFEIQPKEKIGIVGRTGAGKSSLINALFRLSYNEGAIIIDARNTNELGLHDLRSKISIIPQEPVLFSGTLRYNLDPFDEYPDHKLWTALEEVELKEAIEELGAGLQSKISEGGGNFSVGQRQLVCLARAILRENKILLMDEATANVDPQTDGLIQETIRNKFSDCTVLTIAHRLNTIMDSDKVLVMDAGRCVEFAPPYELLTNKSGSKVLLQMVKKTGESNFQQLLKVAEDAYNKKNQ